MIDLGWFGLLKINLMWTWTCVWMLRDIVYACCQIWQWFLVGGTKLAWAWGLPGWKLWKIAWALKFSVSVIICGEARSNHDVTQSAWFTVDSVTTTWFCHVGDGPVFPWESAGSLILWTFKQYYRDRDRDRVLRVAAGINQGSGRHIDLGWFVLLR